MFILKLILRILAFFILIFSSFTLEMISNFWDESSWVLVTRIVVHTGVVLLIFLLIKKCFIQYWSLKKSFISYLVFCILLISSINIQEYYFDKVFGVKQFNYPMANCFNWGRGLLSNSFTTNSYNTLLQLFPFTTRYIFLTTGDGCRVLRIKYKVNNPKTRKLMCPNLSKIDCFKEVINETSINSTYTISGKILLIAVGAMYAFEEKQIYQIKDHPLVNKDIKERGRILAGLNATVRLFDILSLVESSLVADKGLPGLFKDFPSEEIKKMPPEVKIEIVRALKDDIKRDDDSEIYKMAAGLDTKYSKIGEGLNPRVLDAYMLLLVDEEIIEKVNSSSCSNIKNINETVIEKLRSEKYKKYLTSEELKEFDSKLNDFSNRREYCKN